MDRDEIRTLTVEHQRGLVFLRTRLALLGGDDERWAEQNLEEAIESLDSVVKHLEG